VTTKEEYLEMLQKKLAEWKTKINELRHKAVQAKPEMMAEVEQEVGGLESQLREIELPIQQMIQSGEAKPEEYREVIQPAEAKLEEAFQAVKTKFR
jgi:predicted  nucleic acid-binding Zn-ribbon protein